MAEVTVSGVPEVLKRIEATISERTMQVATGHIMLALKAAAKEESSGPARWQNGVNFPRAGGPGIVTGTHRSMIDVEGPTTSGKVTRGYVVAKAPYAAKLERTYPFFEPAIRAVSPKVGDIFLEHWLRAING